MNNIYRLFLILIVSLVLVGCRTSSMNYLLREEQIVESTIYSATDDIQEKHAICIKRASALYDYDLTTILEMKASFQVNRILNRDEAREMLLDIAHSYLLMINKDKELRPFLWHYPFNANDLHIEIHISNADGSTAVDPDLAEVKLEKGLITYSTKDPEKTYIRKSNIYEYYEYASQIVNMKNPELYDFSGSNTKPQEKRPYPAITIPEKTPRKTRAIHPS